MSSPLLWGPSNIATNLEAGILQGGTSGPSLLSGTTNPTSVAVSANKSSLYQNTSTGLVYLKNDNGSSTNWTAILTSSIASVGLLAGMTTGISIPNTANTDFPYDTVVFDSASAYNTGTGEYTIPSVGIYLISAQIYWPAFAGYTYTYILKNGAAISFSEGVNDVSYGVTTAGTIAVSCIPGDVIKVQAYQASAAAHTTQSDVTASTFSIIKAGIATTGAGINRAVSSIAAPTTAAAAALTDYVYLVSGTTTLTLPTAVGNTNLYTIKNTGVATVTIATTGGQTIDGSASATLAVANTSLTLISDNANWRIV